MTKEQEQNIANDKGTEAKHCQQQRNRSKTLPTTKEQEQNIANNKGTGAGVASNKWARAGVASTGFLLPRAPHVVVARPVVGLEVRVLRFELEGARLGLECACLLVKGGGLLAIESLCQRHVRTVLM
jgi:hypothetical protein